LHIYLDFEEPIKEIEDSIVEARLKGDDHAVDSFEKKLDASIEKVYTNLDDYQKLQLARHPDRPYSLDYINLIMNNAHEIHGDRHFRDDPAIVCYMGYIDDKRAIVIGQEKGRGTKVKIKRNFGMPSPEGYRKVLRIVQMAEKFDIPVLMLIDTPGAYPGLGAEERNQSEAIARNLFEFSSINTSIISVVIGEGGSGGALAMGVADKLAMMRYSVFSVISPEGCSAILWKDNSKLQTATAALKITSTHLKDYGLIDDIIDEPINGAHRNKKIVADSIKEYFLKSIKELEEISDEKRAENRYKKMLGYGSFDEDKE
jgi:acetyl-CoA carboxylase carboxyl transferase subunit alpha